MIFAGKMFLIELGLIIGGFPFFYFGTQKEKDFVALIGVFMEFAAGCSGFVALCSLIYQFFAWIF